MDKILQKLADWLFADAWQKCWDHYDHLVKLYGAPYSFQNYKELTDEINV